MSLNSFTTAIFAKFDNLNNIMKRILSAFFPTLLLAFLCLPGSLWAQENKKYLEGAVPLVDGKVVFTKIIPAPHLSQDQIYDRLLEWAGKRFVAQEGQNSRILYSNKEKGEIACWGEEYLVFTKAAFSLDRTLATYQTIITCEAGQCKAKIASIRYAYNVATQNEPEKYVAEEIITDEYTLNKNKDKLIKKTGKFRIHTINMVDKLFEDITAVLFAGMPAPAAPVYTATPSTALPSASPAIPASQLTTGIPSVTTGNPVILPGYRQIAPDKIPGNIIKMLSEDWMLITAGNDSRFNTMTASWGGLGHLYNKPVAFCFINPARYTYQLMENGDTYTLTFYTEAYRDALNYCGHNSGKDTDKVKASGLTPITTPSGAKAFTEAWLIIECRKLVSQSLIPEAISQPELKAEWSGKPMHKMYIGEILKVWVK